MWLAEAPETPVRRVRVKTLGVFGAGVVVPSTLLVAGGEGAGKSTATLGLACEVAAASARPALYVSAEMATADVVRLARRLGHTTVPLAVLATDEWSDVEREARRLRPAALVVDSLPMMSTDEDDGARAELDVARGAVKLARELEAVVFVIQHATADDRPAGPRRVRHEVDGWLWLSPTRAELRKWRHGRVSSAPWSPGESPSPSSANACASSRDSHCAIHAGEAHATSPQRAHAPKSSPSEPHSAHIT